jgi:hypothetical protein
VPTVDANALPHATRFPIGKGDGLTPPGAIRPASEEEKKVDRVANEVAHKAAKTEQKFDKQEHPLFSK